MYSQHCKQPSCGVSSKVCVREKSRFCSQCENTFPEPSAFRPWIVAQTQTRPAMCGLLWNGIGAGVILRTISFSILLAGKRSSCTMLNFSSLLSSSDRILLQYWPWCYRHRLGIRSATKSSSLSSR